MVVKEIMTTEIITASTDDTVEKCANLLLDKDISGLPVLDSKGRLVGIVTEGDLIRRVSHIKSPAVLSLLGGHIYLESPQKFMDEIKRSMALKAGELMTTNLITVEPEDTIEDAATLMINKKVKSLPVVDKEGNLVGIVSRRDIMSSLY